MNDSIFVEQEEKEAKRSSSDNIEEMFDAISKVSPFEKDETNPDDMDVALGLLRRSGIETEVEIDETLDAMSKQLGKLTS